MIGIISAMREEIQALIDKLENVETTTKGMRTYYKGLLFGKKVVLVFSRWGKVASATTATQLINDYDLEEIIFTGVAGAIQPELNIGDIIIGNRLFQYDVDASPFFEKFAIPILDKKYFKTNAQNRDKLVRASQTFIDNYSLTISDDEATNFGIKHPKVVVGNIASGDQFINTRSRVDELKSALPNVDCIEMEGAAVAQVCYEYNVAFSIIRIISDKAHDNAHIEFQKFAKSIATKYALGIFKTYMN